MQTKRYQIFLSSTFSDLEDERRKVMQALLEMDCIPSGMEFFPASDEETFEFIKTIIDESDYYILILAGRYGSVAADGLSYTEKEYDYALKNGKPVLSFVRKDISSIKSSQTDKNPDLSLKMENFRNKVLNSGKLAKHWDNSDQLSGQVISTLTHAIKRFPQPGWMRGSQQASTEILEEINNLRKENDRLKTDAKPTNKMFEIPDLVNLEAEIPIRFSYIFESWETRKSIIDLSLMEFLRIIGHNFRVPNIQIGTEDVESYISINNKVDHCEVEISDIRRAITQLELLNIINVSNSNRNTEYILTPEGLSTYLFSNGHSH